MNAPVNRCMAPAGPVVSRRTGAMTMTQVLDPPPQSGAFAQGNAVAAGPPPLIAGESPAAYEELLLRVANALQPADVLEEIWIRDVVDLVWEASRLRRLKVQLMSAAAHEGMAEVLRPLMAVAGQSEAIAKKWAAGEDPAVLQQVESAIGKAGLTMDAVAARTLSVRIADFERIERMLMAVEARRAAALHQLDRHRENFGLRLRCTLQAIDRPHVGPVPA